MEDRDQNKNSEEAEPIQEIEKVYNVKGKSEQKRTLENKM